MAFAKAGALMTVQLFKNRVKTRLLCVGLLLLGPLVPASAADLGDAVPELQNGDVRAPNAWSLSFTTYSWLPWLAGDLTVRGRTVDVDVSPDDVISALDWSSLPVWMSYTELRNGPLTLFNDIVYSALEGSGGFRGAGPLGAGVDVNVDYTQLSIELGAAYQVWSQGETGSRTAFEVLVGGRYWRQDTDVTVAFANLPIEVSRSGTVDWVDPFLGARLLHKVAPGQELMLRGDVGGFGAGSDFSWQAIATYNWKMCATETFVLDAYLGYRALYVDYSEGSGASEYEYDVLQHGPVMGLTMRF